jgi:predicted membrane protein
VAHTLKRILCLVLLGGTGAWSVLLFLFLMNTQTKDDIVSFGWFKGGETIIAFVCSFLLTLTCQILFSILSKKVFQKKGTRKWIEIVLFSCVFFFFALRTPFSPAHDAYDMTGFLNQMLQGQMSDYATAYLSFTVTNRMTLWLYLPLVLLFQSVAIGVKLANVIFVFSAMLLIAGSTRRIFRISVPIFLLLPICPYLLLSGPYIYPPAIFLGALSLFLFSCRKKGTHIFSYLTGAMLFLLRPTALIFLLVFVFTKMLLHIDQKQKWKQEAVQLVLILLCCVTAKWGTGNLLYHTNAYPYPNLTSSAATWTLELGTRFQGVDTGVCTYSAYQTEFDDVSHKFHTLWQYYARADSRDTPIIQAINRDIKMDIIKRTRDTILSSPKMTLTFLKNKYINLFADRYQPYYYITNMNDAHFGDNLSPNYEKNYFLMENTLLFAYALCSILLLFKMARSLYHKRKCSEHQMRALSLLFAMTVTCLVFLTIAEVAKRYLFDFYVPMAVIVCYASAIGIKKITSLIPKRKSFVVLIAFTALLTSLATYTIYHKDDMPEFADCTKTETQDEITIHLKERIIRPYYLLSSDGTQIPLLGMQSVTIPKSNPPSEAMVLLLPNGTTYTASRQRVYH